MELVVGFVVRIVLWCANWRGDFLWRFGLMSVEMNGPSVGAFLFGMVIWVDYFIFLGRDLLGKMVGLCMVMELVVQVVVAEAVDVVRADFFVFFRRGCLGNMVAVRVVIEAMVGVVVLVWWRLSVVREWVWEFVVQIIEEIV